MTAEIVKLPYSVFRRVIARRPRRSKNGTPEERAAKAAAPTAASATVVNVAHRRKPADLKVHCSVAQNPNVPLTMEEFRSIVEQMSKEQLAQLEYRMRATIAANKTKEKKAAGRLRSIDEAYLSITDATDPPAPGAA
jgi:hypothetical protein